MRPALTRALLAFLEGAEIFFEFVGALAVMAFWLGVGLVALRVLVAVIGWVL